MVSRRNFVAITIIMAIVLFLFQGLNVAREKLNYYDTNAYAKDKETLADGSGAFGAVDASDQINIEGSRGTIVYIGAEKSDSIGILYGCPVYIFRIHNHHFRQPGIFFLHSFSYFVIDE